MKRWKKIALVLLGLVILSQFPFVYRRYRLGRLSATINQLNLTRVATANPGEFVEYKGVMHVHSFLGGHSSGSFAEIIAAAKANQLNFVTITEHPSKDFDTAAMTLKGIHAGVLFVNGNEIATANQDRLLVLPGDETAASASNYSISELLSQEKAKRALVLVAYPQEFKSWSAGTFDGVEVYNVFTNTRRLNSIVTFFDGLWCYRSYPDLLFATFYERPGDSLRIWDDQIAASGRQLTATAGNDAHANVGLSLNDASGRSLLGFKLDPYERSFRLVRMHVLLPGNRPLDTENLLSAIRDGHCFIAFDLFGDTTGFRFSATNGAENRIQGDQISLGNGVQLAVSTPISSRIVLLENGRVVGEQSGVSNREFSITEKGVYRVEVYLPQLPGSVSAQPWIISNPIYVR
jgi:hypothetical protein